MDSNATLILSAISLTQHEWAMRAAIKIGETNAKYPFGAVMTDARSGQLVASGVLEAECDALFMRRTKG